MAINIYVLCIGMVAFLYFMYKMEVSVCNAERIERLEAEADELAYLIAKSEERNNKEKWFV